jgi:hypothetical protein
MKFRFKASPEMQNFTLTHRQAGSVWRELRGAGSKIIREFPATRWGVV